MIVLDNCTLLSPIPAMFLFKPHSLSGWWDPCPQGNLIAYMALEWSSSCPESEGRVTSSSAKVQDLFISFFLDPSFHLLFIPSHFPSTHLQTCTTMEVSSARNTPLANFPFLTLVSTYLYPKAKLSTSSSVEAILTFFFHCLWDNWPSSHMAWIMVSILLYQFRLYCMFLWVSSFLFRHHYLKLPEIHVSQV